MYLYYLFLCAIVGWNVKKRYLDIEGRVINHVPEYYDAVNAVERYLTALQEQDIDRSDIIATLHMLFTEADFHARYRTGPAKP